MLKPLLGLAALLGLSYMVADKEQAREYTRQLNRKAWPWSLAIVIVVALLFLFG